MRNGTIAVSVGLALLAAASAQGVVVWNEGINGDLSNDRLNPTGIMLNAGSNTLTATSVSGDREYVRFALGPGLSLTNINVIAYNQSDISFIGVQAGTTFTEPPTGTVTGNLLGYTHFGVGNGTVGTDILDNIGTGPGSQGFTPPLTGANYTFWIQQTGGTPTTYTLDFVVVPGPSAGLGTALALAGFARRRRRA